MWWFQRRRKSGDESKSALIQAKKDLEKTKQRTPEVKRVTETIKGIDDRNHYADQLYVIFGGK